MKIIKDRKYFIIGILLGILIFLIMLTCFATTKKITKQQDNWVLRSYEDTVVLMNNGEVVEVFGDIVLDTLPKEDVKHLENGIPFLTKDEALMAIEDYDG